MADLASHQGWLDSIDAVSEMSEVRWGLSSQMRVPEWGFTRRVDTV